MIEYNWTGVTIPLWQLSKNCYKKYWRLRKANIVNGQFPPILAEKSGRGHMIFVPSEWGGDTLEFKIAMECYANTPGVLKVV